MTTRPLPTKRRKLLLARFEIKSPVERPGFLFELLEKLRSFKQRRAISVASYGNARASGQTHQLPQQQRDARYQRTEAAQQDEKKKVFHTAILFLQRRRLSRQSVPAISRLRSRSAVKPASGFSQGTWRGFTVSILAGRRST